MSLPGITAPSSAPVFLADGHGIDEEPTFTAVKFATGHSRTRSVRTAGDRTVTVEWFLEAGPLFAVDDWFENVLQAGTLPFAARVANQDGSGLVWWTARWVQFRIQMLHKGRGRLSGVLFLSGDPSDTGPDLEQLASEVSIALAGQAEATVPAELAAEVSIALVANSANTLLEAEALIDLDGDGELTLTLLSAEIPVALDGSATVTVDSAACAPFTVLGDTGISIDTEGLISPLADAGETFDSCRVLT